MHTYIYLISPSVKISKQFFVLFFLFFFPSVVSFCFVFLLDSVASLCDDRKSFKSFVSSKSIHFLFSSLIHSRSLIHSLTHSLAIVDFRCCCCYCVAAAAAAADAAAVVVFILYLVCFLLISSSVFIERNFDSFVRSSTREEEELRKKRVRFYKWPVTRSKRKENIRKKNNKIYVSFQCKEE